VNQKLVSRVLDPHLIILELKLTRCQELIDGWWNLLDKR